VRVLHVVPYFPPERPGGVGEYAARLHRALREAGHESTVVTRGTATRPEPDVLRAARTRLAASPRDREDGEELPDFSRWGEVEREPLNALRRTAARRLARAWREIPHVTQHEEARIETLEGELERRAGRKEPKITLTAVAVKAVAVTLREHPRFNSSYDKADESLVLKKYVHVGVAVDTERGLLVPDVRDAERKSLGAIAQDVARLAEKARAGDLGQDDMEGGTFTVTNLGGLGGTAFTPIVNPPQVAILGLARARDGRLPLSLSYDHRVIDGADAVRFVRHVAELLESPLELLAEA